MGPRIFAYFLLGVAFLFILILGSAIANESSVLAEYSGGTYHGGVTLTSASGNEWKEAPENPKVVYISVLAPEPYGQAIERSITEVAKVHNLTPIVLVTS
ncbi:hypothetical protein [Thermococcus peptonophilus]|uniref:Uncharacterized protein n=1 Tax=Thermococcus peptonophilus TaxID=53952 RepID=A0A142CWU8_9EURY|nr:hypothetical protein [Thermococcus peptonophilus]AMQ19250.1 hypothetical protein A0127_08775 [Thermococcus peptonophilus]